METTSELVETEQRLPEPTPSGDAGRVESGDKLAYGGGDPGGHLRGDGAVTGEASPPIVRTARVRRRCEVIPGHHTLEVELTATEAAEYEATTDAIFALQPGGSPLIYHVEPPSRRIRRPRGAFLAVEAARDAGLCVPHLRRRVEDDALVYLARAAR
jgi:hypothetical protein